MNTRSAVYLVVFSASMFSGCSGMKSAKSANAGAPPDVEVYTAPTNVPSAGEGYTVPSTLAVEHEADLLAEAQGRLTQVLADEGRRVKRGQVLAQLDDFDVRRQYEQDRAEMQSAEVQSREVVVLRQSAEVELGRQSDLRKEGLGTQRDYDRARFNLEAMRHEVEKAKFELEKAKAKVAADEIRLSRMRLKAPFDGIVSRRYARVGETLMKDQKILRLTELHPLLVRFAVPESLRRAVETGAVVEVFPADQSTVGIKARVIRTGYVVDPGSGSVGCIAQLLDPPASLVPGMSTEVKIAAKLPASAASLWIPRSAVRGAAGGGAEVFAVKSNRLERRSVKLGRETTASVQILGGISAGDKIVVQVSDQLQEGMTVRVRQ
jgi:RND family efflux transporter MFP subunit